MILKKAIAVLFLFLGAVVAHSDPFKVVFLGESSSKDAVWLYRVECMREAAKDMGLAPDDIALIGQVVGPAAVQGISEGYMHAGVNLELTGSSYDAVLDALAVIKLDASPKRRSMSFVTVTKDNIATVVPTRLLSN